MWRGPDVAAVIMALAALVGAVTSLVTAIAHARADTARFTHVHGRIDDLKEQVNGNGHPPGG